MFNAAMRSLKMHKFSKAIVALVALFAMFAGVGTPAQAVGSPSSLSVGGFATMKSALSAKQKTSIGNFTTTNTGIATISCIGYTGYNYKGVSKAKLRALAKARATNACAYAAQLAGATVGTLTIKTTGSKNASIRKVILKFTYAPVAGQYQYSMSNLDAGTVQHGGPVTGFFHEGDLVASTFADSSTLDGYAYIGVIDGGTAAYFDHWNTSADDTGTSYHLGDHLGPIPAATTVTLYAIPATG